MRYMNVQEICRVLVSDGHRPGLKGPEAQLPGTVLLRDQRVVLRPRIGIKAVRDLGRTRCAQDEERIARSLQRAYECSESLIEQGVHELGVVRLILLPFERLRVIPRWSTRPQHGKNAFHRATL